MSFIRDVLGFEKFSLNDMLKSVRKDPERLLLGAVDPFSTRLWNKTGIGKDWEPITDQLGGPYSGSAMGGGDEGIYGRARAAGVPTGPGGQMHEAARAIASIYAGNYGAGKLPFLGGGGASTAPSSASGGGQDLGALISEGMGPQGVLAGGGGGNMAGQGPQWLQRIFGQGGAPGPSGQRFPGPQWLQKATGGFNKMTSGMAGPTNPLLSQPEQDAQRQRQSMAMMAQLFAGSGPAPVGTRGMLQPLGEAMMASQQAGDQFTADAIRTKLVQAQLAQAQRGGQDRADPNVIRALVMAGIDPKSQQGQEIVIKSLTGSNDALAEIQAQLAIEQRRDQLARDRAADEKTATDAARQRAQTHNTLRRSINQTADIASHTEELEGSFLEAGMPASSWRRTGVSLLAGAGAALGMDVEKLERDLGSFDKLKKGMADQLNNLLSTGSLGQPTNDKLQSFRDALANTETSVPAILSIQAGIAEALLEEADAQGFEVENRAKVEENIKRWRAYETSGGEPVLDVPGAARAVSDFSRMTIDQLRALDPAQMTPELLEAAKKRWDELNAR